MATSACFERGGLERHRGGPPCLSHSNGDTGLPLPPVNWNLLSMTNMKYIVHGSKIPLDCKKELHFGAGTNAK